MAMFCSYGSDLIFLKNASHRRIYSYCASYRREHLQKWLCNINNEVDGRLDFHGYRTYSGEV